MTQDRVEATEHCRAVRGMMIAGIFLKHFIDNAATYTAATLALLTPEQISDACRQVYEQMPTEKLIDLHLMFRCLKIPLVDVLQKRVSSADTTNNHRETTCT